MFLRNVGDLLPDYTALHLKDSIPHSLRCENVTSQKTHLSLSYSNLNLQSPVVTIRTTCFNIPKLYILPHTVYLCVSYGSHNKQRLFPQQALTGWAL
jgi:hypothetical protein